MRGTERKEEKHSLHAASHTRVVVVEDDADACEVLSDLLREEGYDVQTFGDGAEAFRALRASAPPDLILLDLRLPGMDGWEFRVQQKREPRLAQVPVIALSADRSSQAQAIDADEFLEKPPRLEKLLSTVRDVLERAAEARRRANQVALESMAALGQLAAGVAHEINNPLAYVCGNLHVLGEETARVRARVCPPDAPEELRASFDEIQAMLTESLGGAERIRDIVRDMRLLAKVDDVADDPVALHPMLDSAIGIAQNLSRVRVRIVKRYGGPPDVLANQGRLVHAFFNLIANAMQSITEQRADGEVAVETGTTEDGNAFVRVKDNGAGIPREIRGRIFEPFFSTRGVGAGRGLGLSVSLGIVSALGGTIDVESTVGVGSTFTVTLPAAHPVAHRSSPAPAPPPRRSRVLVIDDEPAIGRVLSRVLSREFDVTVAATGSEGLGKCVAGEFDVILCDLQMDGMSGVDVFTELSRARPGTEKRMMFMSGGVFGGRGFAMDKLKDSVVLDKPIDADALVKAIKAQLTKG